MPRGKTDMADPIVPIVEFLNRLNGALGVESPIEVERDADGVRLNMTGDDAEILARHRGEPLKALQHIVDMAFSREIGDDTRVFIDALGYRKGKDLELPQMAKYLATKAKDTGVDQQLGPLNPYERRLVHMAAAEVPGVSTESVGDAFTKTVTISARK
jgi:spoIIIJ-associated protein